MAKRVLVRLIDDIDGTLAAETIQFGVDGNAFEIDLSETNAAQLREVLAPFAAAGRRLSAGGAHRTGARSRHVTERAKRAEDRKIREWADRTPGMAVSARGKLPERVREAYYAAHR